MVLNGVISPDTDVKISKSVVISFQTSMQWAIRPAWNAMA
jgi:hypothetical protein